jgi:energy-coupling factor transporter ATP-binding protein EcfA2
VRVASVEISHFRGVAHTLQVSFGAADEPKSAIIFGENGSGKSSIVDAVEWACQGRVGRVAINRRISSLGIVNETAADAPAVAQVLLNDGRRIVRRAAHDQQGGLDLSGDEPPRDFARVPMSIKRADILRFLETPPRERGKLFLDHALALSPSVHVAPTHAVDPDALSEERHEAKRSMRQAAAKIAAAVGAVPPRNSEEIDDLLVKHVYKGFPPERWGMVRVPRHLEGSLREIAALRERVSDLNRRIGLVQRVAPGAPRRLQEMHQILGDVSGWLTAAFHRITGAMHISGLDAEFGASSDISIDIWVILENGARRTPHQVFSEGYQDLIALLYFLAVVRAAGQAGQARVLILDDVLQSVDSAVRLAVMELVVEEFHDWQLLVTVHDRLWRIQLLDIFRRAGHAVAEIEIRTWEFRDGPQLASASATDPAAPLLSAIATGNPHVVSAVAGRVLEQLCDRMSWTLPITVQRRRQDAYTLGDLWPGILKALKRTTCRDAALDVDRWVHLRNAAGAHYNEWAESLSWSEAERFGRAVLTLLSGLRCASCGQWVERAGRAYACRCGETVVTPEAAHA